MTATWWITLMKFKELAERDQDANLFLHLTLMESQDIQVMELERMMKRVG